MEALKLERFHVAGNSMGGMLAAMYGAKYPQKVLTLALLALQTQVNWPSFYGKALILY